MTDKAHLRQILKRRRADVHTPWRGRAILSQARRLLPHDSVSVGLYSAFGTELNPAGLCSMLLRQGQHELSIPVVIAEKHPLVFRRLDRHTRLKRSGMGILEPDESAPECWPDILFVPILGIDRRGYRLGYGGGFYDRTLAGWAATGHKQPLTIGLAYEAQVVHRLPAAPHDIPLNMLVTEAGCRRFR